MTWTKAITVAALYAGGSAIAGAGTMLVAQQLGSPKGVAAVVSMVVGVTAGVVAVKYLG